MDSWGVLVWNMSLMSPPPGSGTRNAGRSMAYFWELVEEHAIKIALLNEASVYQLRAANKEAEKAGDPLPFVFSEEGTGGRDFWTKRGVRKLKDRKKWSAAVMSPLGPKLLGENDVRARAPFRRNKIVDIPFTNSRPGTWIAATVRIGREKITCISLYGLIEELTDASMHRSLSDISPIFSDPNHNDPSHNKFVLLGGDFNVSTGLAYRSGRERSRVVLDRIRAYCLDDCLANWVKEQELPPLPGCRCEEEPCRHTLTRLTPNRPGANVPWQERNPIQVDYLFASKDLASRLDDVIEIPPDKWEPYSDHRPIIVKFRAD